MQTPIKTTGLLLSLLLFAGVARATHIIGGEVNYRCLGNDQYEITLQLFRDCDTGVPWFDDPATILVLDAAGNEIDTIGMRLRNNDTLDFAAAPCAQIPPSACIHTTTYREIRTLPFRSGGYQLVYQICCRNQDIVNIVDPLNTRASYYALITEEGLTSCNSAPKFDDWPPFYLCNGNPINYTHNATDVDGDSIVYSLYTPYNLFTSASTPRVIWQSPYNQTNMLGGPFVFTINPSTGQLSGIPFTNGTFIVGICAEEYRNGVLIGRIKRDFQYIIVPCVSKAIADFSANNFPCNTNLDVIFDNESSPIHGPFVWDFGDGNFSSGISPTHTYADSGNYTVTLIAAVGGPCADTTTQDVRVDVRGVTIELVPSPIICNDRSWLVVAQNLYNAYNEVTTYNWQPAGNIISGQGTDSVWIRVAQNGATSITLRVENNFGCRDFEAIVSDTFPFDTTVANFDWELATCNTSFSIPFENQSIDDTQQFWWDFGDGNTSTLPNPLHQYPDTGSYEVRLIAGVGAACADTLEKILVVQLDGIAVRATDDQILCKNDTLLLAATTIGDNYFDAIEYIWSPEVGVLSGQGTDSLWLIATSDQTYTLVVRNIKNCTDTVQTSVNISNLTPIINTTATPSSIYVGQSSQLEALYQATYQYEWVMDSSLSDTTIFNPIAKPRQTTTYPVLISNDLGCQLWDSVTVTILPPICDNPLVFVPNAFSPNNDGRNDVLMVNGNQITEMNFVVYNRWGERVFESNDQARGWDGAFKGSPLPPDVYGYYMRCTCDGGGQLLLKGNITLLR